MVVLFFHDIPTTCDFLEMLLLIWISSWSKAPALGSTLFRLLHLIVSKLGGHSMGGCSHLDVPFSWKETLYLHVQCCSLLPGAMALIPSRHCMTLQQAVCKNLCQMPFQPPAYQENGNHWTRRFQPSHLTRPNIWGR